MSKVKNCFPFEWMNMYMNCKNAFDDNLLMYIIIRPYQGAWYHGKD